MQQTPPDSHPSLGLLTDQLTDQLRLNRFDPSGAPLTPPVAISRLLPTLVRLVQVTDSGLLYREDPACVCVRVQEWELSDWCIALWEWLYDDGWTDTALSNLMKKIKRSVKRRVATLEKRYIQLTKGVFWDMELATLSSAPPADHYCFLRLLDNADPAYCPAWTADQLSCLRNRMTTTFDTLVATGDLPEDYAWITTWACGDHDRYMDMIRGHAYTLLAHKPNRAYMLIGPKRNGKSTYVKLLGKILGDNNTTHLTMQQMADPHYNLTLAYALANAPDEEDEVPDLKSKLAFQKSFKSIAVHEPIPAMRYFSQEPTTIATDFLCFFPMNHLPTWEGKGADACMERSAIISFYADLAASDNRHSDFFRDTFTPDVLVDYLGTLLGIAQYYNSHNFDWSPTMEMERKVIAADVDSGRAYFKEWSVFFDGYQNKDYVWKDYIYWCEARGLKPRTKAEFEFTFRQYNSAKRVKAPLKYGKGVTQDAKRKTRPNVFRIPHHNREVMVGTYTYDKRWGSLDEMHTPEKRMSIVDFFAADAQEVYGDAWLEKLLAQKGDEVINVEELEQPSLGL